MERKVMDILFDNPIMFLFIGMILVGMVFLVVSFFMKRKGNESQSVKMKQGSEKDRERMKDLEELQGSIFELYKEIEIAKMRFRFDTLKEKMVEELYLECEKDWKEIKKNHQKMVSTDIRLEEFRVLSRYKKKNIEKICVFLHVSQYDYVVNQEKVVVRGTDEDRYQIEYKLVVDRDLLCNQYRIRKRECVGKWIKK